MKNRWTLWIAALAFGLSAQAAPKMKLSEYLKEVEETHLGIRASSEFSRAGMDLAAAGRLLYSPSFFFEAAHLTDATKNTNPSFLGTKTTRNHWNLGLESELPIGASLRLEYTLTTQDTVGAQSAFLPLPVNTQASPTLSGSLSLWRNLFGSEIRARKDAIESQSLATSWGEKFRKETLLAEAEFTYWRLSLARESVKITQEILSRTEKMVNWARSRAKLNLSDESDFLQINAAYSLGSLDFQTSQDEEESAELAFLSLLSSKETKGAPELEPFPEKLPPNPTRTGVRSDLKAEEFKMKAVRSSNESENELAKPNLEIFGSYGRQSLEVTTNDAISKSFDPDHYQSTIGVRFSTPLDFWALSKIHAGHRANVAASEAGYERKAFEIDQDWRNLLGRYDQALEKLRIANELSEIQEKKLTRERNRLSAGRSTTFQLLQFQQDHLQAELWRVRMKLEIARLRTQMKLFGENQP